MRLEVREVARLLTVSEDDVFRWVRRREIPFSHVHEHYWFNSTEVLEWATSRGMHVAMDLIAEASPHLPRLADALEIGGIHHDVPGTDPESLLRNIVARLSLPTSVDKDLLVDMLLAREDLGSTGVEEGIAIPHVRNPIVLGVDRAGIALCFPRDPVGFGALGGTPITTVFMLITPTVRDHLHLLSRVAFAVHDRELKRALAERAPRERILAEVRRIEEGLMQKGDAP
jgi:PTS system nitrogen regulatory IIA component